MSIDWMTEQLLRHVDRLRAEVERLGQERDALKAENEKLKTAVRVALLPTSSYGDVVEALKSALTGREEI